MKIRPLHLAIMAAFGASAQAQQPPVPPALPIPFAQQGAAIQNRLSGVNGRLGESNLRQYGRGFSRGHSPLVRGNFEITPFQPVVQPVSGAFAPVRNLVNSALLEVFPLTPDGPEPLSRAEVNPRLGSFPLVSGFWGYLPASPARVAQMGNARASRNMRRQDWPLYVTSEQYEQLLAGEPVEPKTPGTRGLLLDELLGDYLGNAIPGTERRLGFSELVPVADRQLAADLNSASYANSRRWAFSERPDLYVWVPNLGQYNAEEAEPTFQLDSVLQNLEPVLNTVSTLTGTFGGILGGAASGEASSEANTGASLLPSLPAAPATTGYSF